MKLLILLSAFPLLLGSAVAQLVPSVIVTISFTNAQDAAKYAANHQAEIDPGKNKFTSPLDQSLKTVPTIDVNGNTNRVLVTSFLFFQSTNDLSSLKLFLSTNSFPIGSKGLIAFHLCPADGSSPIKDWLGCKIDPRAQYQEIVIDPVTGAKPITDPLPLDTDKSKSEEVIDVKP